MRLPVKELRLRLKLNRLPSRSWRLRTELWLKLKPKMKLSKRQVRNHRPRSRQLPKLPNKRG